MKKHLPDGSFKKEQCSKRERNKNKTTLTTIGINHSTNRQIDKLCKRYSLKKGEAVKLAFEYMDKASIIPRKYPTHSQKDG